MQDVILSFTYLQYFQKQISLMNLSYFLLKGQMFSQAMDLVGLVQSLPVLLSSISCMWILLGVIQMGTGRTIAVSGSAGAVLESNWVRVCELEEHSLSVSHCSLLWSAGPNSGLVTALTEICLEELLQDSLNNLPHLADHKRLLNLPNQSVWALSFQGVFSVSHSHSS